MGLLNTYLFIWPFSSFVVFTFITSPALLLIYHLIVISDMKLTRRYFRSIRIWFKRSILKHTIPISVNYHFTRKCNAECGFCFHTDTTSFISTPSDIKLALSRLHHEGMEKINFAGGEPFLYHSLLGTMCQFAKEGLGLQSVSIVTNGTKVTEKWFKKYGAFVDILAVSCDSFDSLTNAHIGRADRASGRPFDNVRQLYQIRAWCQQYGIKFKLNTVVCSLNWREDMVPTVRDLAPFRWKVFQVLIVGGENETEQRKRDARKLAVSDKQFAYFCERHGNVPGFTPESNVVMRKSYLILDEYLRFLDGGEKGSKSKSILEVGVQEALAEVEWDQESFVARGGVYDWSARGEGEAGQDCGSGLDGVDKKDLEF